MLHLELLTLVAVAVELVEEVHLFIQVDLAVVE
jgi:hypothetical protein